MGPQDRKVRVLIVDDSAIVRKILRESLASAEGIEVVGTAPDPYIARDKIMELKPDVLTLDIEMPRMNGLTFLQKLMRHHPMPVIVISSLTQKSCSVALDAMRLGAVDVLAKPGGPYSVGDLTTVLAGKVKAAAAARPRQEAPASPTSSVARVANHSLYHPRTLIAIGASTGGTEAIREVLEKMPANSPGTVITQHIPAVFSEAFAQRLDRICAMRVREGKDGDRIEPGLALVAPGDRHMLVVRRADGYTVSVQNGPKVCFQRPSVDVLFNSVADSAGEMATAALLTGMGSDGARGLKKIRDARGVTIAQDEASCVVFGMPKEAILLNAAQHVLPLDQIAQALLGPTQSSIAPAAGRHEIKEQRCPTTY